MRILKPLLAPLLVLGHAAGAFATDDITLQPCVDNHGMSLVDVLGMAFGFPDFLIDGPAWMWRECVDIEWPSSMKEPSFKGKGVPPDVYRPALQRELASRLQVSAHTESKMRDIWVLRLAADGRAVKLKEVECVNGRAAPYYGRIEIVAVPLSLVVVQLSTALRSPVTDETSLSGCFTFNLTWSKDGNPAKAVADQLGLELEAAKRPVDTLFIDHVERWPSDRTAK